MKKVVSVIIMTVLLLAVSVLPSFAYTSATITKTYWAIIGFQNQPDTDDKMLQSSIPFTLDISSNDIWWEIQNNTSSNQSYERYQVTNNIMSSFGGSYNINPNITSSSSWTGYAGAPFVKSANFNVGGYNPVSFSLNIEPDYYIYNSSELTKRSFTIDATGIDKSNQVECIITNPQGISKTTMLPWQFGSFIHNLWQLNDSYKFWTTGNYNLTVVCDGHSDTGVFGVQTSNSPSPGTLIDSDGVEYEVEATKQAFFIEPRQNQTKEGRFSTIIKTNKQPYRLANGKSTYSIYYYMEGNKLINGTLNSDVLMLSGEERYWYSSDTLGKKDFVLYVGENPTSAAYSGSIGSNSKTTLSTWQHPENGKWYIPIDIVSINYGRAPTIQEELDGPVSPYQQPGQTTWESLVSDGTTQSGIGYTMPGIKFDWDESTSSVLEFLGGFSTFFSMIGSMFSFIPPQIMALGFFGATLSVALMIFRR